MSQPTPPPFQVDFFQLTSPGLEVSLNPQQPESPSLPLEEQCISKNSDQAYIGEQYKSMIIIKPQESQTALSVLIKVEYDSPQRTKTAIFNEKVSFTDENSVYKAIPISLDINFPGMWAIIVSITYESESGLRTTRRTLNVNASVGVGLKYKISKAPTPTQAYVLETQVENITPHALAIKSCKLSPLNGWQVDEVTSSPSINLQPKETYQFIIILKNGKISEAGHISVEWSRQPYGVAGQRSTHMIKI